MRHGGNHTYPRSEDFGYPNNMIKARLHSTWNNKATVYSELLTN